MLLHNLCIDPIIAYCHRFLEISVHRIMIFMTMILDRKNNNIYIHKDSHLRLVEEEYDVTECLFSTKLSHWMSP